MSIRQIKLGDAPPLTEIYNFYIQNTHHTSEIEPVSFEEMEKCIGEIVENYPYFVKSVSSCEHGLMLVIGN